MITEDYVSFEVAKLLKERGFNEEVLTYFIYDTESKSYEFIFDDRWDNPNNFPGDCISAPTLQMAMKWLREVHNLCILVEFSTFEFNKERPFMWSIMYQKVDGDYIGGTYHPTYEEACESGIRYCLENLI